MLKDNIRIYRIQNQFSQEELAMQLHVVRQTVSKWEKGLSVPDSEMLIRLAAVLGVPVSKLLDETTSSEKSTELQELAQKLENNNQLLAEQSARRRKTRKNLFILGAAILFTILVWEIISAFRILSFENILLPNTSISYTGGVDGPQSVQISGLGLLHSFFQNLFLIGGLILCIIGMRKNW